MWGGGEGVHEWALSWNKDIKHLCSIHSVDAIDGSEIARKTIDASVVVDDDDDDSSSDTGFAEKQYIVVCFKGFGGNVMTHVYNVYTRWHFLLRKTTPPPPTIPCTKADDVKMWLNVA